MSPRSETSRQTFLFADLAGYTALTEAHGDEEAVRMIEDFCEAIRRLLPAHGGREVKLIGDAFLIRVPLAREAILLGLRLTGQVGVQHGFPAVRVGMHHGSAIERNGDYFGRTVNIAARVSALAGAGEVLLTAETLEAAGMVESVRFTERGGVRLKGLTDPVFVYVAADEVHEARAGLPIDPVCHMVVEPSRSSGSLTYRGVRYEFCSLECAKRFAQEPGGFVEHPERG